MNLPNFFNKSPFNVSSVKYKKPIDQQLVDKLIGFLSESKDKIIVMIDGSINTLVAGALVKRVKAENGMALIFDFETAKTNQLVQICKYLGLESYLLNRNAAYQKELSSYNLHKLSDIKNFYKKFINYHLSIQAENMKAKIIDTVCKSDRLLDNRPDSFYGHLMPFYSCYKSELFDLANLLGIPHQDLNNSNYQDLLYPNNIALPWDKMDPILFLLTEKQLTPEQISQDLKVDLQWLKKLKSHIDKESLKTTVSQLII